MKPAATANPQWLLPKWPAPPSIKAAVTTRQGGVSSAPYESFNLGDHVGDKPDSVALNRQRLSEYLKLPSAPLWLNQVHGSVVCQADRTTSPRTADAITTRTPHKVCAILTADCLPILLCSTQGNEIAAIHAGWRGLVQGVIQKTLSGMHTMPEEIIAWLGPAIGSRAYEIDRPVFDRFIQLKSQFEDCFIPTRTDHWQMDIYAIARFLLRQQGVTQIHGGEHCTYSEDKLFFSHRREGITGRMASLIWIS